MKFIMHSNRLNQFKCICYLQWQDVDLIVVFITKSCEFNFASSIAIARIVISLNQLNAEYHIAIPSIFKYHLL
jgi:hypothetical protein